MTDLSAETQLILHAVKQVETAISALAEGQDKFNERLQKAENRIVALNVAVFGVGVWAMGYLLYAHLVK